MRETFFGPLIKEVEERIIEQLKQKWDRELFEQRLTGYTMRTERYRLVVWKDTANPGTDPIFVELYDHQEDPAETVNIAERERSLVFRLLTMFDAGWQGSRAVSTN